MKTLRLALSGALLLALCSAAHAANLAGKWKAEFSTMIGIQKYVFEFKIDGAKLTGRAIGEREGEKAEVPITEGRITNQQIFFVELLNFQGQEIRITYTGALQGDDELKLTRQVGDVATEELVARRVKG